MRCRVYDFQILHMNAHHALKKNVLIRMSDMSMKVVNQQRDAQGGPNGQASGFDMQVMGHSTEIWSSRPVNRIVPCVLQENALMPMPDMSMRVAEQQPDGQTGQVGTGEQGKRRTVAEHFFFFLKQPGATPEFLQELHRLAQSAM